MIEVQGLVKRFGATTAVDGLDLAVAAGEVLGVLGPNGAGKTTMINVLATLLRPDGGSARIVGFDVVKDAHRVRQVIALTGQFAAVDEDLTGAENLALFAGLQGLNRRAAEARGSELLEQFGLTDAATQRVKTYSGGMRRRLDLAASIVTIPKVLFLDEPTTGLDPRSRSALWQIVRHLRRDGMTIVLTTQYLEEADVLADRIAVIDHGRVIAEGTASQLKARVVGTACVVSPTDSARLQDAESALAHLGRTAIDVDGGTISIASADAATIAAAVEALRLAAIDIDEIGLRRPSLDEVFMTLTDRTPVGTP